MRELIQRKLKEHDISMKAASEAMGRNHSYLQQFLSRGVPATLKEEEREALARLLIINPEELRQTRNSKRAVNHSKRLPRFQIPATISGDKIPVLGASEGGPDGRTLWNGEIVDYIERPPELVGTTRGFATYVIGSSMEPRYFQGEIVYVAPGRPVNPGDFVLVEMAPASDGATPQAFVKRLVRRTATKVVLAQYNPAKEIDLPAKDVVHVYKIVGSGVGS